MRRILVTSILLGASYLMPVANAEPAVASTLGDVIAGKMLAAAKCAGCHGTKVGGNQEGMPDIAGMDEAFLVKETKAFKMGFRTNLMMTPAATSLTDKEVVELSAYYASLKK